MDDAVARFVRERAAFRCEYCRLPAAHVRVPFEIEHVIARQHGGTTAPGNLAFACLHRNRFKGPNLSGLDPATPRRKPVRLFHPRLHHWDYHFAFDGSSIVGRTAIGRATVAVLNMNDPLMVSVREELIADGLL